MTVLLGMNNPRSRDPRHALFPWPPGCAGYRLWRMLNVVAGHSRGEYCAGFVRDNLLHQREWNARQARASGEAWRQQMAQGSGPLVVLVLGRATWAALGLPAGHDLILPLQLDGITWRHVPHPSGRSRFYNNPVNRLIVGMVLEQAIGGRHGLRR